MRLFNKSTILITILILFCCLSGWFISNITIGMNNSQTVIEYSFWVAVPEEIEANRLIINAFHQENPDIHVVLRHHPWADYFTKLYTGIVTDTAPDVLRMSYAFLPDYVFYDAIEPLDSFIKSDTLFHLDDFVSWPFEACIIGNDTMKMPLDCHIDLLYYNKKIFDRAAIPYPNENWSWDDLIVTGLKLKSYFSRQNKNDVYPLGGLSYSQLIMENGAHILDRSNYTCTIDSPAAIEAIQFLADLLHKYKIAMTPEAENSVGGDPFLIEKCAMSYGGAYMMQTYHNKATFDWDFTYRPKGKVWLAKNLSCGLCMTKNSRHKQAAWRLIEFFVSEQAQTIFAKVGAFVPIRRSVLFSEAFLPPNYTPQHKFLLLDVENSHSQNWICRNWGRFRTAIGQEMDLVYEGKLSPAEACTRAAIRGNRILDEVYGR